MEAVSVKVKAPVRVPVVLGVKVTLTVQEDPVARVVAQLLVWEKSPVATMLVMPILAVPELVSVIGWDALLVPSDWLAKVSAEDENKAIGAPWPVPSKVTVWLLPTVPPLLSDTVKVP